MPSRARARRRPTVVVLVRHGETPTTGKLLPGRAPGLHLTDKGREQAQAVADRLSSLKKVDAVYASPLERTRETAAPIAKAHALRVRTDRRLLDLDVGDWTGAELKALRKRPEWPTIVWHPSGFAFPAGESFVGMQARILEALAGLRDKHPGGTIVVVSHADVIKAVAADALGSHLDLFQRIVISPCSVTAIAYGDGLPRVLTVNAVGDIGALGVS